MNRGEVRVQAAAAHNPTTRTAYANAVPKATYNMDSNGQRTNCFKRIHGKGCGGGIEMALDDNADDLDVPAHLEHPEQFEKPERLKRLRSPADAADARDDN